MFEFLNILIRTGNFFSLALNTYLFHKTKPDGIKPLPKPIVIHTLPGAADNGLTGDFRLARPWN